MFWTALPARSSLRGDERTFHLDEPRCYVTPWVRPASETVPRPTYAKDSFRN